MTDSSGHGKEMECFRMREERKKGIEKEMSKERDDRVVLL